MMNKHEELAIKYFTEGYNCAQSVFAAFHKEMGIDEKMALKMSSAFGGGMGRLREVCGAVSGMFMVLSTLYGYDDVKDAEAKTLIYNRVQELAQQFKNEHDSIICRELISSPKAKEATPMPGSGHAGICFEYVKSAARIMSEFIDRNDA